ncbi:MAG: hypothetical protein QF619_10970 [Candidatus Binatia bacterium]|nr:hypothetical protein [Candidatus Binatia bacterium]
MARMAFLGRGFYKRKVPLRAIGVLPSWDRLFFPVREKTGIQSLEEIRDKKIPSVFPRGSAAGPTERC